MIIPDKELKHLYNLSRILGMGSSAKIPYPLLFVLGFAASLLLTVLPLLYLIILPYILYVLYLNGRRNYILSILICFLSLSLVSIFLGDIKFFSIFGYALSLIIPVLLFILVKMELQEWIGEKEWELQYKFDHENPLNKVEDFIS